MCILVIFPDPGPQEATQLLPAPPGGLGQENSIQKHFTSTFHLNPVLGFRVEGAMEIRKR